MVTVNLRDSRGSSSYWKRNALRASDLTRMTTTNAATLVPTAKEGQKVLHAFGESN